MLQNLHTHTTFCDGTASPEEVIKTAISRGFDSIGFSSHAPSFVADDCEMKKSEVSAYTGEVKRLKDKYESEIPVFLGIEADFYSEGLINPKDFDYIIGSVHYSVLPDGRVITYDYSAEMAEKHIKEDFSGDGLAYAKSYYERLVNFPLSLNASFIGHFDIVTKFSDKNPELFDADSKAYKNLALEALHTLSERYKFFEVNTGAMARGVKSTPYPAPFLLKEMKNLGVNLILTSDCHNPNFLDFGFAEAKELILSAGFDEIYYLTKSGFLGEKI